MAQGDGAGVVGTQPDSSDAGQVATAEGGQGQGEGQGQNQGQGSTLFGGITQMMFQMAMFMLVMNIASSRNKPKQPSTPEAMVASPGALRNLYHSAQECDLYIHLGTSPTPPSVRALLNSTLAAEEGYEPIWHSRTWYVQEGPAESVNVSYGPLSEKVLSGEATPYIVATMVQTALDTEISPEQVVTQSLPLVAWLRELSDETGTSNLFASDDDQPVKKKRNMSSSKVPYIKTKLEIRPVFDQTIHTIQTISQGPFKKLKAFPDLEMYQPYLYVSDFWLLEKDYIPMNDSLTARRLNMTLSHSPISVWAWSLQAQMTDQWTVQGGMGITDTQRDSFMLKRLYLDTNPYLLAFSGAFIMLHTVFSMLAFKNDVQFWRKNESMQGLSARSMCISFVCQLITALYLLDSRETSRMILFEILLDLSLATWKLRKAVKFTFVPTFPFVDIGGQKGYENAGTSKYDTEAVRYMAAIITPLFFGYSLHSALYGKHRGWYSFLVSSASGGVYTFGFVMMTPQLYINYKLKSVEHLPWRALTYKAMNTFVDDVAALLIDMPLMHRLSCFRDDIIFFIYIYQRWAYRVDKARPSIWVSKEDQGEITGDSGQTAFANAALPAGEASAGTAATSTDAQ